MVLDGIDVFVEVVDAQSFSGAARRLGMPTTTVSAKLARLEKQLGVTLLHRTTRKLNVTEAGRRYHAHCVRALKEMAAAEQILEQGSDVPTGCLRITATAEFSQTLLAPIIKRYLDRYSQVSVELNVSNNVQDLIAEKIDLAVRIGDLADSSLVARRFLNMRVGLWASETYLARHGTPATVSDLSSHNLIGIAGRPRDVPLIDRAGQTHLVTIGDHLQVDDLQTCKAFVEADLGIGPLPEFISAPRWSNLQLRPVLPDFKTDEFTTYLVYPRQSFVPPKVRKFIEMALEET